MRPGRAGIAAFLALLALAAAYWWWMRPERQIHAMLDDVAAAFTHDRRDSGLEALTAAAALEKHLAPDVSIEVDDATRIVGRPDVITAAARLRAGGTMMRVRFFDPRITFTGDAEAMLAVTLEVTTRSGSGEDVVAVHHLLAALHKTDNRWLVSNARKAARNQEPPS